MGWFDKKSWQLRRKIRDLQAELAEAEREGKYVVEQGLFFAELQEMGDATLMVLGTADHLDAEEDSVIRNFFGRNGFSVEHLRLDKTQKTLAAVEIIPPQELTRRVAMALKEDGFKLIDDSDQERPSHVDQRRVTLSGLIRAISALFATHVHKLIINTPIKMNMEGNRLLHWMPLVREALVAKSGADVVNLCREPFVHAYNHYYGQLGRMENPEALNDAAEESPSTGLDLLIDEAPEAEPRPAVEQSSGPSSQWEQVPDAHPDDRPDQTFSSRQQDTASAAAAPHSSSREAELGFTLASIYKSLVGVSDQRRVRNAEVVLDIIARFFGAKSACLLMRMNRDATFAIHANSSGPRCVETTSEGALCGDVTLLQDAIDRSVVTIVPATNGSRNPQAVIAPLNLDSHSEAVLYLAEPTNFADGKDSDAVNFSTLSKVFREFPDLLLAEKAQKNETTAES